MFDGWIGLTQLFRRHHVKAKRNDQPGNHGGWNIRCSDDHVSRRDTAARCQGRCDGRNQHSGARSSKAAIQPRHRSQHDNGHHAAEDAVQQA